jgi:hypothetical protein
VLLEKENYVFELRQCANAMASSRLTKNQRDYQKLLLVVREHREWLAENYPSPVSCAQQAAAAEKA